MGELQINYHELFLIIALVTLIAISIIAGETPVGEVKKEKEPEKPKEKLPSEIKSVKKGDIKEGVIISINDGDTIRVKYR